MVHSFDQVARRYDATRSIPHEAEEALAARIIALLAATPATRMLEVGVGTGRIALPFLRQGLPYLGVDLSAPMLAAAQAKAQAHALPLFLARAEATALPFANASVDVGFVVHVFHLIPDWLAAFHELLRVIKPGGFFLYGSERWQTGSTYQAFNQRWRTILAHYGVNLRNHGATDQVVLAALQEQGLQPQTTTVAIWVAQSRVADLLAKHTNRVLSSSWQIPDDIYTQALADLTAWVAVTYPDPATILTGEQYFALTFAQR